MKTKNYITNYARYQIISFGLGWDIYMTVMKIQNKTMIYK